MGNSELALNQVIRKGLETYRILWLDEHQCYWIRLEPPANTPRGILRSELESGLSSGEYSFAMVPPLPHPTFKNKESAMARRDRIWELIHPVVEQEPDIYDAHQRSNLLKELEERSGVKATNIYTYLGKYWRAGKIPDALLPDYRNVGKTKDPYSETSAKVGVKARPGMAGKKLTHADLANFETAYEKYYVEQKYSLLDTYQNMLLLCYSQSSGSEQNVLPADQVPSRGQFYYWHKRTKSKLAEVAVKKGPKSYNLECRGGVGKTETNLYGPCALAQIDATIADMSLVRQDVRTKIVGRPTVYFVLDAYSHMVIGMHISLEPPSWEAASMALLNSMEDKVAYCASVGVHITQDLWPCRHMPSAIVGDRGEMEGYAAEKLVSLGIRLSNTPPYRGDLKGIVESHFRTLNYTYGSIPGHVEDDFGDRCTHDYRLDSVLDIRQFTAIVIRCVLFHNNIHYMKEYPRTFMMRQHEVMPIPRDVWNFGMAYLSGVHRVLSHAEVRYELLPQGVGSITRRGIYFNSLYYTCEQAEKEKWFDKARTEHREKVQVSYDPRNSAFIYLRYGGQNIPIECHLVEYLGEMVSLTHEEVDVIHQQDSQQAKQYVYVEDSAKAKLTEQIQGIVNEAKSASQGLPKESKAARIRDIPENRKEEIQAQAKAATKESIHEMQTPSVPEKTKGKKPDAVEDMLQKVFKETENS